MAGIKIKPVPGYGDVLKPYNQVSVLTLADRVNRDIMLPVLDQRSDSVLNRSQARFMRSQNGSALKHSQPVVLADLESIAASHRVGSTRYSWKPEQPGWWYSIDFSGRSDESISLAIYNGPDDLIHTMTFGDPILWLPRIQGRIYLRALGTNMLFAYFRLNQYG